MREPNLRVSDRLIAIGDIHGHAEALRRLLDKIQPTSADTIVILGDCVNRGPDSRGVLDCLIELQQKCHLVPVLGNHDDMMLESHNDRHAQGLNQHSR
jgi:serine/threonine protein phosphatase 1